MNRENELEVKQKLVELLNKPIKNLLQKSYLVTEVYNLFEEEFKSRVNAISDEDIKKAFPTYVKTKRINSDKHYNFLDIDHNGKRYGAKWFKNKLLKK